MSDVISGDSEAPLEFGLNLTILMGGKEHEVTITVEGNDYRAMVAALYKSGQRRVVTSLAHELIDDYEDELDEEDDD